jgi:hypothetical protein
MDVQLRSYTVTEPSTSSKGTETFTSPWCGDSAARCRSKASPSRQIGSRPRSTFSSAPIQAEKVRLK